MDLLLRDSLYEETTHLLTTGNDVRAERREM